MAEVFHTHFTQDVYSPDELVASIRQNDRNAFDYLYKNYSCSLYRTIMLIVKDEHIAQDILQETFIKIWKNIEQYANYKGGLYCWMRSIATNAAIDNLRTKVSIMRKRSTDELTDRTPGADSCNPDTRLDYIGVQELLKDLQPEQRQMIHLAYYQGYTFEQIAVKLKRPLGTVKTQIRTILKTLRSNPVAFELA